VKTDYGKWFISNNVIEGNATVTADNWNGGVQPQGGKDDLQYVKLASAWPSMAINQQTAEQAFNTTIHNVGATLPKRDIIDTRVVHDALNGDAACEGLSYKQKQKLLDKTKKCGIIDSQVDVGGWPELKSTAPPTDTDHDGMPDDWEIANKLNPNNADDRNNLAFGGYTMLEKYLNSIEFNTPVSGYLLTKSDKGFQLKWSDNYLAEEGFIIERSFNGVDFEKIATVPKYSNSYTDNSVKSKTPTYRVVAFNTENSSPRTTSVSYSLK